MHYASHRDRAVPIGDSLESTARLSIRHAEREGQSLAWLLMRVNRFEAFRQTHGAEAVEEAMILLEAFPASSPITSSTTASC